MKSLAPYPPVDALPRKGRLAGIDYGTVRIGVAITDPDQQLASPLDTYTRRGGIHDAAWFKELVAEQRIVGFVVGLPVHMSGAESQKSADARRFARWLGELTQLPVRLFDERYTTVQAEAILQDAGLSSKRRRERLDMLAAQIVLASYLESTRRDEEPGSLG